MSPGASHSIPLRSSATRLAASLPTISSRTLLSALFRMMRISSSWSLRSRSISASSSVRARSSFSTPRREKTWAPITVPATPGGTRSEVSRTSPAFSPKIARSRRSSGESWVSPFGVILPTRMSSCFTSAPMRTMPASSRSFRASSPTFGMSRVMSSLPSFVSRATHSNSSMWIEVK